MYEKYSPSREAVSTVWGLALLAAHMCHVPRSQAVLARGFVPTLGHWQRCSAPRRCHSTAFCSRGAAAALLLSSPSSQQRYQAQKQRCGIPAGLWVCGTQGQLWAGCWCSLWAVSVLDLLLLNTSESWTSSQSHPDQQMLTAVRGRFLPSESAL